MDQPQERAFLLAPEERRDPENIFTEREATSPMLALHLARLGFQRWSAVDAYNGFLQTSSAAMTRSGRPVRFASQQQLGDALGYEQRIYETGVVATRERDHHDLFNALTWSLFPQAKAAINARHYSELRAATSSANKRTRVRDALTLFDESGVIVASTAPELLTLIRDMRWKELFWRRRDAVVGHMRFFVFGHGLCEQALRPFVGLTGKALLLHVDEALFAADMARQLPEIDALVAAWCDEAALAPSMLHPLPALGVPGWWEENQSEAFYDDARYFRSTRASTTGQAARIARDS